MCVRYVCARVLMRCYSLHSTPRCASFVCDHLVDKMQFGKENNVCGCWPGALVAFPIPDRDIAEVSRPTVPAQDARCPHAGVALAGVPDADPVDTEDGAAGDVAAAKACWQAAAACRDCCSRASGSSFNTGFLAVADWATRPGFRRGRRRMPFHGHSGGDLD